MPYILLTYYTKSEPLSRLSQINILITPDYLSVNSLLYVFSSAVISLFASVTCCIAKVKELAPMKYTKYLLPNMP